VKKALLDKLNNLTSKRHRLKVELDGLQSEAKKEESELLPVILRFFKEEMMGIFDDADMNFNVMEEVNLPSGHEKPMSNTQRAAGASSFRHIAPLNKSQGNIFNLFGLSNNEQAMLSDSQFKEHQDFLAEHI
jgi:hypothetical protein